MTAPRSIEVILFDMGGTLEHVFFDEETRLRAAAGLAAILSDAGIPLSLTIHRLRDRLHEGLQRYKARQALDNRELPPERIWGRTTFLPTPPGGSWVPKPSLVFPPIRWTKPKKRIGSRLTTLP